MHWPRFQASLAMRLTGIAMPDWHEAWCTGASGYPLVDAAQRQLNQNRLDAQPAAHGQRRVLYQGSGPGLAQWGRLVRSMAAGL